MTSKMDMRSYTRSRNGARTPRPRIGRHSRNTRGRGIRAPFRSRFSHRLSSSTLSVSLLLAWSLTPSWFRALQAAAPPNQFNIEHSPKQPKSGDKVTITVRPPAATKDSDLALQYQVVEPGKYIALADATYAKEWTSLPLRANAKDASLMAELPGELQKNRRLIRYRVFAPQSKTVLAPGKEDTQPNFAYFVYDGIPEWRGAIHPRSPDPRLNKVVTFGTNVMRSIQAYHLISSRKAIENVTWREPTEFMHPSRHEYRYTGTVVADGKVYDHVRFRARGGQWRHSMGKNMWKFDFNKGHHLEARDNYGRRYKTKWEQLNLSACIQQGDFQMRGEHGMLEAVSFRLFNLAGVEASHTHWLQLRIVDGVEESPANQYQGDFWGLYLAMENPDGDFLEEHGLPDGNLYKIDFGGPKPANLMKNGPTNRADVLRFMSSLRRAADDNWWRENVDLPRYYNYRSILECIHHYDIGAGKNYFYFNNPQTKRWSVVPWDVDLTWGDQMFGDGGEPFYRAGLLQRDPFRTEYQARLVEIRDLLFNPEQTGALIDEYASIIWDPSGGPSFVDADRAKWDYHPIMSSQYVLRGMKTDPGLFYQSSPTRDFRGMLQLMKKYTERRGQYVDRRLLANAGLPPTPQISASGKLNFSEATMKFQLAAPAPGKVKWRLAEITDTNSPSFKLRQPRKYEIEPRWEAERDATAEIPTKSLENGRTYRVRARTQEANGKWSHWSAPVQFTVTK